MESRDDLVHPDVAHTLERTCRTAVGDGLRSITYFTPEAYEQVYLRSDLEANANLAGFAELEADGFVAQETYRGSELGSYHHTVRAFENGYVTRVTVGDRGVFVTTDAMTLRGSEEVATALASVLESSDGPGRRSERERSEEEGTRLVVDD